MKDILPKEEICRFIDKGIFFNEYSLKDIDMIKDMKSHILSGMTMNVWNWIVRFNLLPASTSLMNDYFSFEDPEAYKKISKILGTNIIKDIYYVRAELDDPLLRDIKVAELFSACVYPNNLYLADFDFTILNGLFAKGMYGYRFQDQKVLLNKLIDNAMDYGRSKGCNYLMLAARTSDHIENFVKRGFVLEDPVIESFALKHGLGVPMVRQL